MTNSEQPLEVLEDIRNMMKQSTRFLSLSGLSGVFAGVYALVGAWVMYTHILPEFSTGGNMVQAMKESICLALGVLMLSVFTALYFSARKGRHTGQGFDQSARRLALVMAVPLGAGGVLCAALIVNGQFPGLTPALMLIFYGIALVNASRYTIRDIGTLGYLQIALGFIASFRPDFGLLLWTLGFGVLHVIYGFYMWYKFDRPAGRVNR